jgi:hypothetical protein
MPRPAETLFASFVPVVSGSLLTLPLSGSTGSRPTAALPSLPLPTALLEAQQAFWSSTLSKDTILAYQTRRAKWNEFSERFQRSPQDLSPKNIVDYITYLATIAKKGDPLAYSSIKGYVDFLGRAKSFTAPEASNPVQHPEVKLFLRGVARTLGKQVEKAEPCTLQHLRKASEYAQQNPTNVEAQTVVLIALVAFWGCLRLGALIPKRPEKQGRVLTLGDLEVRGTSLLITVRVSKTIQFAERLHRIEVPAQSDPLLCPLRAFNRWTSLLRPQSSQITLCALSTTGRTQLSHSRFLELFNRIAQPLPPLTGHSFRRGYVRLAFIRGIPIWQVMHHGDWKSLEVAMSYAEDALIPNPLGGLSSLIA